LKLNKLVHMSEAALLRPLDLNPKKHSRSMVQHGVAQHDRQDMKTKETLSPFPEREIPSETQQMARQMTTIPSKSV
jgi:hypothetical protein